MNIKKKRERQLLCTCGRIRRFSIQLIFFSRTEKKYSLLQQIAEHVNEKHEADRYFVRQKQ